MHVKRLFVIMVALMVILLMTACGGGDSKGFKKAGGATVGTAGGEIATAKGEMSIAIPAGALPADTPVEITMNPAADAHGIDQASPVFEIKGIEKYSKPMTVTIKTTKPLGGETYAVVGLKANIPSSEGEKMGFFYLPCQVNGDSVTFTINPNEVLTQGESFMRWVFSGANAVYADTPPTIGPVLTAAIETNKSSKKTAHFSVVADSDVKTIDIETANAYLEDVVYKTYADMGFKLEEKYSDWPISVNIRAPYRIFSEREWFGDKEDAGSFYDLPGFAPRIVINKNMLGQFDDIKMTLMHEFFHFVQGLYGSSNSFLDEASATWIEETAKGSAYFPENYNNYGEYDGQIFSPIDAQGRTAARQGYGSASLIKYLVGVHGKGKLVSVYENIDSYETPEAVLKAFAPIESWNTDFYIKLLKKEIYGGSVANLIVERKKAPVVKLNTNVLAQLAEKEGNAVEPVKQKVTVPPYGAKLVAVEITSEDPAKVDASATLSVKSPVDGLSLAVFNMKGSDIPTVTGIGGVMMPDVKGVVTTKRFVTALAVNRTNAAIDAELEFDLTLAPPLEELVGEWTEGKATFTSIYLHPELLKIANQEVTPSEADPDNPFAGCDEAMAQALVEAFKQIKELEGTTNPSKQKIEQTGPETGKIFTALSMKREMQEYNESYDFKYIAGKLTGDASKAEEKSEQKIKYDMTAVYDKKTKEIVMSGTIVIELWGEGQKAIGINLNVEYRKPIPEGAFAAQLPMM